MYHFNSNEEWYKSLNQDCVNDIAIQNSWNTNSNTPTFLQQPFTCNDTSFGKINPRKRTKRRGVSPK